MVADQACEVTASGFFLSKEAERPPSLQSHSGCSVSTWLSQRDRYRLETPSKPELQTSMLQMSTFAAAAYESPSHPLPSLATTPKVQIPGSTARGAGQKASRKDPARLPHTPKPALACPILSSSCNLCFTAAASYSHTQSRYSASKNPISLILGFCPKLPTAMKNKNTF